MSALVPAIIPTSREDLERKLSALYELVTDVQIDSVDGKFAQPACWPYTNTPPIVEFGTEDQALPYLGSFVYEIDLMVQDADTVVGAWVEAGASRIVLHAESTPYLAQAIQNIQTLYGHAKDFAPHLLSLGLAVNIKTDLAVIEPFLDRIDYVQFMGIDDIGKQGQSFDPLVLRKIKDLRNRHDLPIQVDGGIKLDTAKQLLEAGVTRLVVGSDLWKASNLGEEVQKFKDLIQEYGIE